MSDERKPELAINFYRPSRLAEALALKAGEPLRILAGGTDFYPALRDQPVNFPVLDITAIDELRAIRKDGDDWSIGANVTWTDIQRAKLPVAFEALRQAAHEVGSLQIQNRATIVGNLCNASPAADGIPPLLILNARVEISSHAGTREKPLTSFIQGNRKTSLKPNEIVTRILVPIASAVGNSAFLKLGARKYLVISIAMVAARVVMKRQRITEAAIAIGSCSEVAQRLPQFENTVIGLTAKELRNLAITPNMIPELKPIDDVRATAIYRKDAAAILTRNAVLAAMGDGQ